MLCLCLIRNKDRIHPRHQAHKDLHLKVPRWEISQVQVLKDKKTLMRYNVLLILWRKKACKRILDIPNYYH